MASVFEEDQRARDREIEERERKERWEEQDEVFKRRRNAAVFTDPAQKLIALEETASVDGAPVATASSTTTPPDTGLVKRPSGSSLRAFRGIQRRYMALRES